MKTGTPINRLPNQIRKYRFGKGYSTTELGAMVGKSSNTITAYERGEKMPNIAVTSLLCAALDATAEELFPPKQEKQQKEAALGQIDTDRLLSCGNATYSTAEMDGAEYLVIRIKLH